MVEVFPLREYLPVLDRNYVNSDIGIQVRYLPKWFPGATFHKAIESWRPVVHANEEETYDFVKRQLVG